MESKPLANFCQKCRVWNAAGLLAGSALRKTTVDSWPDVDRYSYRGKNGSICDTSAAHRSHHNLVEQPLDLPVHSLISLTSVPSDALQAPLLHMAMLPDATCSPVYPPLPKETERERERREREERSRERERGRGREGERESGRETETQSTSESMCVFICICIYIYTYTHTFMVTRSRTRLHET